MSVVIPYGAMWRTLQIPQLGAAPSGWETAAFDDSAWATAAAPFGEAGTPACPIIGTNPPTTTWTRSTDRLFRHQAYFSGIVTLQGPVDDQVTIWLDGVEVLAQTGGSLRTGACAHYDDFTVTATVGPGTHLIAVRGWDAPGGGVGNHTFFDLSATALPRGGWSIGPIEMG